MVLLGLLIATIVAELFLRHFIDPVTSMAIWFQPKEGQKAYEWQFIKSDNCIANTFSAFDPDLGWDIGEDGTRRVSRSKVETEQPPLRILFIGDSFVYGSEVSDMQTTSHYVTQLSTNTIVANMGVPGFGIGQSYLKLIKKGLAWEPNIVVFGIHPPNYERTVMEFFSRPKPRFWASPSDGKLMIDAPPLFSATPDFCQSLKELRKYDFFFAAFIKKVFYRLNPPAQANGVKEYFVKYDPVIRKILKNTQELLTAKGIKFIVLQIPHGTQFKSDTEQQRYLERYPIPQKLNTILDDIDVIHVDLKSEMMMRFDRQTIFDKFYTHPKGSKSAGHLSPFGNQFAAEMVHEKLCLILSDECLKYLKSPNTK